MTVSVRHRMTVSVRHLMSVTPARYTLASSSPPAIARIPAVSRVLPEINTGQEKTLLEHLQ